MPNPHEGGAAGDPMTVAMIKRLTELRYAQGLSQTALGGLMGTSQSMLCQYETGAHFPSMRAFLRWAAALGYTVALVPKDQQVQEPAPEPTPEPEKPETLETTHTVGLFSHAG